MSLTRGLAVALALVAGCGGGTPAADAGTDAGVIAPDLGADLAGDDAGQPDLGCDRDRDGHDAIACGGDDCDDRDPSRYPGALEECDPSGHDEDCNPATLGPDADGDGFPPLDCCNTQTDGTLLCGTDCDDTRATVSPTAVETCNSVDDDCNGLVDDGVGSLYYPDADGDGFGNPTTPCSRGRRVCVPATGCVLDHGDCNDENALVYPGAAEVCDGLDNDCNPATPDPTITCYADADRDGYRDPAVTMAACTCPSGWTDGTAQVDCYDHNSQAHPGTFSRWFNVSRGDGSFDYDCDGVESEQVSAVSTDPASACTTPSWYPSAPACGATAPQINSCSCTVTWCTWTTTSAQNWCR